MAELLLYPRAIWIGPAHPENYMVGRQGTAISEIDEHHTACNLLAAEQTFWDAPASGKAHSAHLIFDRDGAVYQVLSLLDTAYGASDWNANLRGIQKEHVSGFPGDPDYDQFTLIQYAESEEFNRWAGDLFGVPIDVDHDRPHNFYSQTACPGALDLARIIEGANMDPVLAAIIRNLGVELGIQVAGPDAGKVTTGGVADVLITGQGTIIALLKAQQAANNTAVLAAIKDLRDHPAVGSDPVLVGKVDALAKHLGIGTA